MAEEYTLLEKYENDNQGFESFTDFLLAEVERLQKCIDYIVEILPSALHIMEEMESDEE